MKKLDIKEMERYSEIVERLVVCETEEDVSNNYDKYNQYLEEGLSKEDYIENFKNETFPKFKWVKYDYQTGFIYEAVRKDGEHVMLEELEHYLDNI